MCIVNFIRKNIDKKLANSEKRRNLRTILEITQT